MDIFLHLTGREGKFGLHAFRARRTVAKSSASSKSCPSLSWIRISLIRTLSSSSAPAGVESPFLLDPCAPPGSLSAAIFSGLLESLLSANN
ncbi:hypothetical protein Mapa_015519 [Marchantia paleacea]|nr:hypothetical protein Mapa_015519 [Marchantia paleacea]